MRSSKQNISMGSDTYSYVWSSSQFQGMVSLRGHKHSVLGPELHESYGLYVNVPLKFEMLIGVAFGR